MIPTKTSPLRLIFTPTTHISLSVDSPVEAARLCSSTIRTPSFSARSVPANLSPECPTGEREASAPSAKQIAQRTVLAGGENCSSAREEVLLHFVTAIVPRSSDDTPFSYPPQSALPTLWMSCLHWNLCPSSPPPSSHDARDTAQTLLATHPGYSASRVQRHASTGTHVHRLLTIKRCERRHPRGQRNQARRLGRATRQKSKRRALERIRDDGPFV